MKSPIFIFSLPRSGSTLLQRILMGHPKISTASEPWICLPFAYATKGNGLIAEYSQAASHRAIFDFISTIPNGEEEYYSELNKFISSLYEKHCQNGEFFFLDKTPRYYLIIDEISLIFPDAKFIFLFRNPLHIMSSLVQTFSSGTFKKYHSYAIDLDSGLSKLSKGFSKLRNKSYSINYEDLILNPDKSIREVCNYLEIDYDQKLLKNFSKQKTKGKFGDPVGPLKYSKIENEPLQKWKKTFSTKYSVKFATKFLETQNSEDLKIQGYDKKMLIDELKKGRHFLSLGIKDFFYIKIGQLIVKYKLNILFGGTNKVVKGKFLS